MASGFEAYGSSVDQSSNRLLCGGVNATRDTVEEDAVAEDDPNRDVLTRAAQNPCRVRMLPNIVLGTENNNSHCLVRTIANAALTASVTTGDFSFQFWAKNVAPLGLTWQTRLTQIGLMGFGAFGIGSFDSIANQSMYLQFEGAGVALVYDFFNNRKIHGTNVDLDPGWNYVVGNFDRSGNMTLHINNRTRSTTDISAGVGDSFSATAGLSYGINATLAAGSGGSGQMNAPLHIASMAWAVGAGSLVTNAEMRLAGRRGGLHIDATTVAAYRVQDIKINPRAYFKSLAFLEANLVATAIDDDNALRDVAVGEQGNTRKFTDDIYTTLQVGPCLVGDNPRPAGSPDAFIGPLGFLPDLTV